MRIVCPCPDCKQRCAAEALTRDQRAKLKRYGVVYLWTPQQALKLIAALERAVELLYEADDRACLDCCCYARAAEIVQECLDGAIVD